MFNAFKFNTPKKVSLLDESDKPPAFASPRTHLPSKSSAGNETSCSPAPSPFSYSRQIGSNTTQPPLRLVGAGQAHSASFVSTATGLPPNYPQQQQQQYQQQQQQPNPPQQQQYHYQPQLNLPAQHGYTASAIPYQVQQMVPARNASPHSMHSLFSPTPPSPLPHQQSSYSFNASSHSLPSRFGRDARFSTVSMETPLFGPKAIDCTRSIMGGAVVTGTPPSRANLFGSMQRDANNIKSPRLGGPGGGATGAGISAGYLQQPSFSDSHLIGTPVAISPSVGVADLTTAGDSSLVDPLAAVIHKQLPLHHSATAPSVVDERIEYELKFGCTKKPGGIFRSNTQMIPAGSSLIVPAVTLNQVGLNAPLTPKPKVEKAVELKSIMDEKLPPQLAEDVASFKQKRVNLQKLRDKVVRNDFSYLLKGKQRIEKKKLILDTISNEIRSIMGDLLQLKENTNKEMKNIEILNNTFTYKPNEQLTNEAPTVYLALKFEEFLNIIAMQKQSFSKLEIAIDTHTNNPNLTPQGVCTMIQNLDEKFMDLAYEVSLVMKSHKEMKEFCEYMFQKKDIFKKYVSKVDLKLKPHIANYAPGPDHFLREPQNNAPPPAPPGVSNDLNKHRPTLADLVKPVPKFGVVPNYMNLV